MKSISAAVNRTIFVALAFVLAGLAVPAANAQTFNVVYSFSGGSDAGNPLDGFVADGSGNLYATSNYGGAYGDGAIFKVSSGQESVLHSFSGGASDGANPEGGLILDKTGNLYGTTVYGGSHGDGVVFKLTAAGVESILYSFKGGSDGANPESTLAMDSAGNLYGTTTAGGSSGNGTVFKLTLSKTKGNWGKAVLYSFGTGGDGTIPVGGIALDGTGNVYGTTSNGGAYGYGIVYELLHSGTTYTESVIHAFAYGDDGATPYAQLVRDKSGNFYGAATDGGTGGGGTVFKLTKSGSAWNFSVIYSNPGWGISGSFRSVLISPSGVIYGTTHCDGNYSAGTVYELTPSGSTWNFTQLYQFTGGTDGLYSFSNPVLVGGNIYGTTNQGGAYGNGVVWEVTP